LLIEKFLQSCRAGNAGYSIGLQWTKLGRGATLQCNVDRIGGGSLTVIYGVTPPDPITGRVANGE
jgi:hypothetical protein